MTRNRLSLGALGALFALAAAASTGAAQQNDDVSVIDRPLATCEALQAVLSRLESTNGDPTLVGRARSRLTEGDFRSGDRILIFVQGDTALSDTFAVWQDQALHLPSPVVGTLPLTGVLRSEIQPKVTTFIARFVRNPMVRARPLIRLSFQGDFAHAGFYAVPADAPLADAFMAAGGTAPTANMNKVKAQRSGREFMNSRDIQGAISSNSTVDDLALRDGDQFSMPRQNPGGMGTALRTAAIIVSLSVGVLTLTRHH